MEKILIGRKELHAMVWSEPFNQLAKKYDLSDSGFRKLCAKHNVPYPRHGYWQKLKYKKPVVVAKLSIIGNADEKITIALREPGSEGKSLASPLQLRISEISADPKAPTTVTEHILKPHRLIASTREYYAQIKKNKNYRNENIEIIYLRVEEANRRRALLFIHALVQLLLYRGHDIRKGRYGGTVVVINDIEIPISLREANKRIPGTKAWETSQYFPTGEFILKTGEYSQEKEWRDSKTKIESHLVKIVARLEVNADSEKKWREEVRISNLRNEEEKRIREEQEHLAREEKKKFDKLWEDAQNFKRAEVIRSYLHAVESHLQLQNSPDPTTQEYIEWAKQKANELDPIINRKPTPN